MLDYC